MDLAARAEMAEASFDRLASERGDITTEVLSRYYARHPGARASFERHGLGNTAELEGRMVSSTAFLIMSWAEDPFGTRIAQGTTIVHHQDTLEVGPRLYMGLIDAVFEVLFETIPRANADEFAMWQQVRAEFAEFYESVRPEFWRKEDEGPLPAAPEPPIH